MTGPSTEDTMKLRILLPFAVSLECAGVRRIIAETGGGSFGMWPHRLDCAAVLVPGIFTYETVGAEGEQFVAVDRGVLVKTGLEVTVSVRNAVTGGDLGALRRLIDEEFIAMGESESESHSLLAKMESEIIREASRVQDD